MNGRLAFNLLILAAAAYFVWAAFSYELAARRIPLLIGGLVLALQLWVTLRELFGRPAPAAEEDPPPPGEARRVAAFCGWMLFYFVLFVALGTLAATFVFLLAFLASGRRLPWWGALALAGAVSGVIWFVFAHLMRFELYPGLAFGGTLPAF
jgi:hypothetical protein